MGYRIVSYIFVTLHLFLKPLWVAVGKEADEVIMLFSVILYPVLLSLIFEGEIYPNLITITTFDLTNNKVFLIINYPEGFEN